MKLTWRTIEYPFRRSVEGKALKEERQEHLEKRDAAEHRSRDWHYHQLAIEQVDRLLNDKDTWWVD